MTRQLIKQDSLKGRYTIWLTQEHIRFKDSHPEVEFAEFARQALDRAIEEYREGKEDV